MEYPKFIEEKNQNVNPKKNFCEMCRISLPDAWLLFMHLKGHYECRNYTSSCYMIETVEAEHAAAPDAQMTTPIISTAPDSPILKASDGNKSISSCDKTLRKKDEGVDQANVKDIMSREARLQARNLKKVEEDLHDSKSGETIFEDDIEFLTVTKTLTDSKYGSNKLEKKVLSIVQESCDAESECGNKEPNEVTKLNDEGQSKADENRGKAMIPPMDPNPVCSFSYSVAGQMNLNLDSGEIHPSTPEVQPNTNSMNNNSPGLPNKSSGKKSNLTKRVRAEKTASKPSFPYICSVCSKIFNNKSNISNHMKSHFSTKYRCEFCNSTFSNKKTWTSHKKIHIRELQRMECAYKCDVCSRGYSTSISLRNHTSRSHVERPVDCPFCNKAFRSYPNLNLHLGVHEQEIFAASANALQIWNNSNHLGENSVQLQSFPDSLTQAQGPQMVVQVVAGEVIQLPLSTAAQTFQYPVTLDGFDSAMTPTAAAFISGGADIEDDVQYLTRDGKVEAVAVRDKASGKLYVWRIC